MVAKLKFSSVKLSKFSLPPVLIYVFGAQKNRLIETFFEYTQYMLWLRNKKIIFLLRTLN